MSIFDKFKNGIDQDAINEAINEAKENGGGFKEVPAGTYEAKVEKIELKETKKGHDMISIWFTILDGEYKGSKLFQNQVINETWQLGQALIFIQSLGTDVECVELKSDDAFKDYLDDVYDEIEDKGLEYEVNYSINKKGYSNIEITEIFVG